MNEAKAAQAQQVVKQERYLENELHQAEALTRGCVLLLRELQAERDDITPDLKSLRRTCTKLAQLTAELVCGNQLLSMAKSREGTCRTALMRYRTWLASPTGQRARGVLDGDSGGATT
ncbi:MAG TPA: hypothetical protein VMV87_03410 [Burkholderiales bacterium]|nr:hypothetical protein [Burkholderiales bacterium]